MTHVSMAPDHEAYLVKHSRRDTNDEIRGRNLELRDESAIRLDIAAVEIGEPKFFSKVYNFRL